MLLTDLNWGKEVGQPCFFAICQMRIEITSLLNYRQNERASIFRNMKMANTSYVSCIGRIFEEIINIITNE